MAHRQSRSCVPVICTARLSPANANGSVAADELGLPQVFPSPVLAVEGASAAPRSLHAPAALRPLSPRSNLRPASQFTSDRPARAEHGRPSTSGVIGRPKPPLDLSFPNANYRSRLVKKKLNKQRGGSPDTAGAREALAQRNAEDKAIQLIAGNGLPWLSQTPEPE